MDDSTPCTTSSHSGTNMTELAHTLHIARYTYGYCSTEVRGGAPDERDSETMSESDVYDQGGRRPRARRRGKKLYQTRDSENENRGVTL
jgi:hypothetical protein